MGSRGLGKTVMLNEFEDAALRAGWLAVSESSSPGLLQRLTRDHLPRLLREHARPRARLTSLSATLGPVGVGAAWEPGPPPESTLRAQINELTDRLADQGGGLALTVDEIQDADVAELRKIGEVLQFSRREGRALAFAGAGLRTGVGALVRSPGATFLRRAMRIDLRDLTGAQAGRALAGPAKEAGRPFDATALALATTVSRGYPYLVQAIGYCAWNASSGAAGITTAHVDRSGRPGSGPPCSWHHHRARGPVPFRGAGHVPGERSGAGVARRLAAREGDAGRHGGDLDDGAGERGRPQSRTS